MAGFMVHTYHKRSDEKIKAIQFTSYNAKEVKKFLGNNLVDEGFRSGTNTITSLTFKSPDRLMTAKVDDVIIEYPNETLDIMDHIKFDEMYEEIQI
jgi:hypothetical protein